MSEIKKKIQAAVASRVREVLPDVPAFVGEVQGHPYDEDAWRLVSEQANRLGDIFNKHFEGKSGFLFWETAGNLETLMKIIEHVNKTQQYVSPEDIHG